MINAHAHDGNPFVTNNQDQKLMTTKNEIQQRVHCIQDKHLHCLGLKSSC